MRICMRPVNLGRLVDIARITQNNTTITPVIVSTELSCSESRAVEILDEMCDLSLLEKEDKTYTTTPLIQDFREAIIHENWEAVHYIFQDHAHYHAFYEMVCQKKSATLDQLSDELAKHGTPHFNKTSMDVVSDWAERIGSVQRNVQNGEIYPVLQNSIDFKTLLLEIYHELNYTHANFLRQTYVEIPKLRETLCQRAFLSRSQFDSLLTALCLKNIGKLELSGAPLTTHAKKTAKKIKHVSSISYSDRLSMKLTSDQFLSGIQINGRMYYYLAYHGGELDE